MTNPEINPRIHKIVNRIVRHFRYFRTFLFILEMIYLLNDSANFDDYLSMDLKNLIKLDVVYDLIDSKF